MTDSREGETRKDRNRNLEEVLGGFKKIGRKYRENSRIQRGKICKMRMNQLGKA